MMNRTRNEGARGAVTTALVALGLFAMAVSAGCANESDPEVEQPAAPGEPAPGEPGPGDPAKPGELSACLAQPACASASGPGVVRDYARHRGRDQIYAAGDPQWIIGNFVVRTNQGDLKVADDVDVFVDRGCSGQWEKLGRTKTSKGTSPAIEGVSDDSGRVFFQIPKASELPVGRHRVRLVVVDDQSFADLWIDVVPRGAPVVVADVDGTLTDSEPAEYTDLRDSLPIARKDAAPALTTLVKKGFHVVYLSSRPEWLTDKTREFLETYGFPRGTVHTATTATGVSGVDARTFKTTELQRLTQRATVTWAFGNNVIDFDAYDAIKIEPIEQRVFVAATDPHGGRRIESFTDIMEALGVVAPTCK